MRREVLLLVLAVLALRLPFLNHAIQGDDPNYLAGAQHAQIDPAHPTHARYVFQGRLVDMRGHPHPPLNAWILGVILAVSGDVREPIFHAVYILFSLAAVLAMWSLAQRFATRPFLATLLLLVSPAFVVSGNSLESDLPFLAAWLAGVALFIRAIDTKSSLCLAASALSLALAGLAAYQAVAAIPILAVYLVLRRSTWRSAWIVLLAPALSIAAWQIFERITTGEFPFLITAGYMQTYALQQIRAKLLSAAALTGHAAWLVFPGIALAAFAPARRWLWAVPVTAAAFGALIDPHPLFWLSFGVGVLVILRWPRRADPDRAFLEAWMVVFFAAALALFFAGSARYLLPLAPAVALLAVRKLADRPRLLAAGCALQLLLSLGLAWANYQHWDGYRAFVHDLRGEFQSKRVWINGEWGLRFYAESAGGLPLEQGQAVQPGDVVVTSSLAFPISFTTGGGVLAPLNAIEIRPALPFRLIGARAGWSSVTFGVRPFDLSFEPADRVRAEIVLERQPTLSFLPMNAPAADSHIVSGFYQRESNTRWMGERGVVLLKSPASAAPLVAVVYIAPTAPARQITLSLDGREVARATYTAPGLYTLTSPPLKPAGARATITLTADRTFTAPGDTRQLGIIVREIGFR